MTRSFDYLDIEIIKRFQKGDQEAFEIIYKKYQKHIYFLGLQYFHDEDKAKDLVQDTFIKVFRYADSLVTAEAFFVWMERIAYSCCANNYRKNKRDASYYVNDAEEGFLEESFKDDNEIDQLDRIQMKEAKQVIVDELERMAPEQRAIAYLRYFEGLTFKEIAEITDTSIGTVMSRSSRIKEKLKKKLEKKNFTKETCFSMLMFPQMSELYVDYIAVSVLPLQEEAVSLAFLAIKGGVLGALASNAVAPSTSYFTIMASVILPISIIVAIATPYAVGFVKNNNELAKISHIEYKKKFTKESVKIDINTTNENYDYFAINGKKTSMVVGNGKYHLSLVKDNEVIDSKEITINNIDKDAPILMTSNAENDVIELYFEDVGSGIDYENIEFYENGKKQERFQLKQENKMILIEKDIAKNHELRIPDMAGNILKIRVNSYEIHG